MVSTQQQLQGGDEYKRVREIFGPPRSPDTLCKAFPPNKWAVYQPALVAVCNLQLIFLWKLVARPGEFTANTLVC